MKSLLCSIALLTVVLAPSFAGQVRPDGKNWQWWWFNI